VFYGPVLPEFRHIKCGQYKNPVRMFKDILVAVVATEGEHPVLCCDDPTNKLMGFTTYAIRDGMQYEWKWFIHINDFVRYSRYNAELCKKLLSCEDRVEIAATLSKGQMPS